MKNKLQEIKEAFQHFKVTLADLRSQQREILKKFTRILEQEKLESIRKKLKG